MRKYIYPALFLLSILNFPSSLFAQTNLNIWNTQNEPAIDSNIDVLWNEFDAIKLNNWLSGSPVDPDDLSAYFKAIWDKENLYVLVDVTDDALINDSPDFWQDDAIEIYLDIDNNKLSSYGANDYQYNFSWNDLNISGNGPTNNVNFSLKNTANGYLLEVKFPWNTLGLSNPEQDVLLGIDVHVHDDDNGQDRDNKICWFATIDQSYQNPSLFATAILKGKFIVQPTAPKPVISVNHGFFEKPFDVTLSSSIPGMNIYYTLDGSDPAKSATASSAPAPLKIRIDPEDKNNRGITPAVTLRAAAHKDGYEFSQAATQTYIFINKIDLQTEMPGHDWPEYNVNDQAIDLLIDERVLNDSRYKDHINNALTQIPSISIVTDNANLFDSQKGIYVNAMQDGYEWERPASIELINPDGSKGFHINAGLRIRGGYSRNGWFRKHAFRLFFRSEYGEGKLDYPLFDDEGVESFDKIDLRCSQNYSWSKGGEEAPFATYNRDVFSRDIQAQMNQPYTRSRYYHLYLNGLYWGLYQTQERSEARYAESYLGNDKEMYDVVKKGDSGIEATDGNLDAWNEIWTITQKGYSSMSNYYALEGLNSSGQRDLSKKVLVDIDNLIDYMNIIFYTGNFDAPVSAWGNNKSPNNFYAIYDRQGTEGFKFFAHDNEHSLLIDPIGPGNGILENRVNIGNIDGSNRMSVTSFSNFQPQWLHHRLCANDEYRVRFADRAYRYFFNNGILSPQNTANVFHKRTLEYDMAIIGESARWGDVDWRLYTKDDNWIPMVNTILNQYFPYRTDIVIEQLREENLLPNIAPPEIRQNNQQIDTESITVASGQSIDLRNPNPDGALFFTTNGSDPRMIGGGISESAVNGENLYSLNIYQSSIIKARIYDGQEWSSISTVKVNVDEQTEGIIISEINYNPLPGDGFAASQFEFIELKNIGNKAITLTNCAFTEGIHYAFNTETILEPGAYLVLASQPITFAMRYGFDPHGQYTGQLDNSGEKITLAGATGQTIISLKYNDKAPWPASTDGLGFSIIVKTENAANDWNDGNNWTASSIINGTPGAEDQGIDIPAIKVNEILASTDRPQVDAIELYNPNTTAVDIGHWFLSDNRSIPKKWQIPAGTRIPAKGYMVFYEGYFADTSKLYRAEHFGSAFSLSAHGEEAYIFSGNGNGQLTGYAHGFEFDDSENGVSMGQHLISTGDIHEVPLASLTLGQANSAPKVGPLTINQIMYHPIDNHFEYLQLTNISNKTIQLYDDSLARAWRISGVDFNFAPGTTLAAGQSIYLIEPAINSEDFRLMKGIDESVQIFNFAGKLDNSGERLEIKKPAPSYYNDNDSLIIPYIVTEAVRFNDKSPWPEADGNGNVLQRIDINAYANDPANWIAVPAGISIENYILSNATIGVPFNHQFDVSGGIAPFIWNIENGLLPEGLSLNGSNGTIYGTPTESGSFNFKLAVSDQTGISAQTTFNIEVFENTQAVALNDTVKTYENFNINIDILNNDIDNDNERSHWGIEITQTPANGTIIINNNQTATYLPNNGFTGNDSFTYQITDYSNQSEATVFIEVAPYMFTSIIENSVREANDDAEENINSKQIWTNSTDLELTYDPNPGGEQIVGIRFQNIQIAQGLSITKAYLRFTTDESSSDHTNLNIFAENSTNAMSFDNNNLISTRQLSNSSVNWQPEAWLTPNESSIKQQTPDISELVQQVVDQSGWKQGNSMAFVIKGSGSRVAHAYDGSPADAPKLYIEYGTASGESTTPVAQISAPEQFIIHNPISLSGTSSYSTDGRPLNFLWTMISKPQNSQSNFTNPYSAQPSFTPDMFGEYRISLSVNNGVKNSEAVELIINIGNIAPIANAGNDQSVLVGDIISLNGNRSYDPEGNSLSYNWRIISAPQGSEALIINQNHQQTTLTANTEGVYLVELVVSDGELTSISDTVTITIIGNLEPVAIAGQNQQVYTGQLVQLNGDQSYDPEERDLNYVWTMLSKPAGSSAQLSNTTTKSPTFIADIQGEYVFTLLVNDGEKNSNTAQVVVTAFANTPPVAEAGNNQQLDANKTVQLDGSGSYDPEGNPLTYLWTFVTKPEGSSATLNNYAIHNPSFRPDKSGLYTLRLQVSDGIASSSDDVQIIINPSNAIATYSSNLSMRVYPNPFSDKLYIDINEELKGKVYFELYTTNGVLVQQIVSDSNDQKNHSIEFDQNKLHKGIYLLMVKSENIVPQVIKLTYNNDTKY